MKKFLKIALCKVVGVSLTALMFYGHYHSVDWALNVSNVYFWILVIASFVVSMISVIGSFIVSDHDEAKKIMENIGISEPGGFLGVIHYLLNVTVMSVAGFFWLAIFYTSVVCFDIFFNSLSVSILKGKLNE